MRNMILGCIAFILAAVAIVFCIFKILDKDFSFLPSWSEPVVTREITKAEIRDQYKIRKFGAIKTYYEVLVSSVDSRIFVGHELIIANKVELTIGLDLATLDDGSFNVKGDTLQMYLRKPSIIAYNNNDDLSHVRYIADDGFRFPENVKRKLLDQALQDARQLAINDGLAEKAKVNITSFFTKLYKAAGFKHVEIYYHKYE